MSSRVFESHVILSSTSTERKKLYEKVLIVFFQYLVQKIVRTCSHEFDKLKMSVVGAKLQYIAGVPINPQQNSIHP